MWPIDDDGNPEWPGPKEPGQAVDGLNQTECYFKGITENEYPYEYRPEWWHVFAARMAFVLAFQVRNMYLILCSDKSNRLHGSRR